MSRSTTGAEGVAFGEEAVSFYFAAVGSDFVVAAVPAIGPVATGCLVGARLCHRDSGHGILLLLSPPRPGSAQPGRLTPVCRIGYGDGTKDAPANPDDPTVANGGDG